MAGSTAIPHSIPYLTATDDLAGVDEHSLMLATRLHALFNERQAGEDTITPSAANTATTKRITFPNSYTTAPKVVVSLRESLGTPGSVTLWATAADATGFTLGIISTGTTNRAVTWMALP